MAIVEDVKMKTGLSYRAISAEMKLPLTSLSRWRRRKREGVLLWQVPGPKEVPQFDLGALETKIRSLPHRHKRSRGTGELYKRVAPNVSRRNLMAMVAGVRKEYASEAAASKTRIEWLVPGVVTSMDETERLGINGEDKAIFLSSMDLGARYLFPPGVQNRPASGEEVAAYLRRQFERFGAPLFYKRDNGGNLNSNAVDTVLEEYGVLPLNSPPYYSPYNGGMERGHQDVNRAVEAVLEKEGCGPDLVQVAERAIQDLNHRPRRVLKGRIPCEVYHGPGRRKYGKRERRITYEWMMEKTASILKAVPENKLTFEGAWRSAAQVWMESQGIIRVHKPRKVSPHFSRDRYHK